MPVVTSADPYLGIPSERDARVESEPRRFRALVITGDAILSLVRGNSDRLLIQTRDGIPADAVVVAVQGPGYHDPHDTVRLVLWSSEFEPMPDGDILRDLRPEFTAIYDERLEQIRAEFEERASKK